MTFRSHKDFAYGVLPLCRPFSHGLRAIDVIFYSVPDRQIRLNGPTPEYATPAGYHTYSVWPLPRSLATTYGITVVFFPVVLRCFTSPRSLLLPYVFSRGDWT